MLHFGKIPKKIGQNLENIRQNSVFKFWQDNLDLQKIGKKQQTNLTIFNENFEIRERCKGVHCVDLGESFPTSIYLQNLASIPPRTSLVKFARSPRTDPPGVRNGASRHRGLRSTQREEGPKQANVGNSACSDKLSVEGCDW